MTSGPDGVYAATGLADGTYLVNVAAPGHVSVYFDGALDMSGAVQVTVAGGVVTTGIDVVLPWAGAISGRVTLADGAPAAGVIVTVATGSRSGAASTAADGTYTRRWSRSRQLHRGLRRRRQPHAAGVLRRRARRRAGHTSGRRRRRHDPGDRRPARPRSVARRNGPRLRRPAPSAGATVTVTSNTGIVSTTTTDVVDYLRSASRRRQLHRCFSAATYAARLLRRRRRRGQRQAGDDRQASSRFRYRCHLHPNTTPAAVDDNAPTPTRGFGPTPIDDARQRDIDTDGDPLQIVAVSETEEAVARRRARRRVVQLPPR